MKIEIGESLMLSYLKHIKKCLFYQTNWKPSSNWDIDANSNDKVSFIYDNILKHSEFQDIFKSSKLEQLIKQSEIDVIGCDGDNTIYAADIAFHEAGLNYGSKIETKNRVFKKLLRTYLNLLAYFPNKKYELIFASPKVNPSTEEIINDYFNVLNKDFSEENVTFKYISNDNFRKEIFCYTIEKAIIDSDTNELFMRAIKLSNLFDMTSNKKEDVSQQDTIDEQYSTNSGYVNTNTDKLLFFKKHRFFYILPCEYFFKLFIIVSFTIFTEGFSFKYFIEFQLFLGISSK
jgi:hypothetical protein